MWTILKGHADWERYQESIANQSGYVGTPIAWGAGPREYPCLVSTYLPPPRPGDQPRLVSAYVYETDALALLRATGKSQPEVSEPRLSRQSHFNRWLAAHTLVWAKVAREVCCVKPEQYEEWLLEALELVDEVRTQKRAEVLAKHNQIERAIIDRLEPPG